MEIKCDFCNKELTELGGLLFSPPDDVELRNKIADILAQEDLWKLADKIIKVIPCKKRHICKPCYSKSFAIPAPAPKDNPPKELPEEIVCYGIRDNEVIQAINAILKYLKSKGVQG